MAQEQVSFKKNGYPIQLYVYDLSNGMAKMYSKELLGKIVEGIWHTAVVIYGKEYFYGGGIQNASPGRTGYGKPVKILDYGYTFISQKYFHDYLNSINYRFLPDKYDLFEHNCNDFANECIQFLLNKNLPEFILGLPAEFLNSDVGKLLKPMIDNMQENAMAMGDYSGMGITNKANLPKINKKYNEYSLYINIDYDNRRNIISNNNNNKINLDTHKMSYIVNKYHANNKHTTKNFSVLTNEFNPKITVDYGNLMLYADFLLNKKLNNEECLFNGNEKYYFHEIFRYIVATENGDGNDKMISQNALNFFDKCLLNNINYDNNTTFCLVSILRLLLVNNDSIKVRKRYKDFKIINKLIKDIITVNETQNNNNNNNESKNSEEKENISNNNNKKGRFPNKHLIEWTLLSAVSHMFLDELMDINQEIIKLVNLSVNILKVNDVTVRLTGSRLLFNLILQIKRNYLLLKNNSPKKSDLSKCMKNVLQLLAKLLGIEKKIPIS